MRRWRARLKRQIEDLRMYVLVTQHMEPVSVADIVSDGRIGIIRGVEIITDGYREPEV